MKTRPMITLKTNPLLLALLLLALLPATAPLAAQEREPEESSENPSARREHFHRIRSYPFDRIPQSARQAAMRAMRDRVPTHAAVGGLQALEAWRPIGPPGVGGRVNAIAVHPFDGRVLYAGAASGGVWTSSDRGATWRPIMDFENAIWVGAIAIDPVTPSTIYVGTGDPHPSNGDVYLGAGIMKSTDAGATWRNVGLSTVGSISGIVIDPRDPRIIVAGGSDNDAGIYRSTDAGETWTRVAAISAAGLASSSRRPDRIFASTFDRGIHRSTDNGLTWHASSAGIGGGDTPSVVRRTSVAVCDSFPDVLFVVADEWFARRAVSRIYRSTDGGDSWQRAFDSHPNGPNFLANSDIHQGWYNNVVAVRPDDSSVAIAGGVSMVRTTDGGRTWARTGGNVHVDHHAMTFDPSNPSTLFNGNDGGVYRSDDAGATFTRISSGLAITQLYSLAIDQSDSVLNYGGSQDNGTFGFSADDVVPLAGSDGFDVIVDPVDPSVVYGLFAYGTPWRWTRETGRRTIASGLPGTERTLWATPFEMDPRDRHTLYVGYEHLYVTRDSGDSWNRLSPRVVGLISTIGLAASDSTIYVGSDRGSLMVSPDAGRTWIDRTYDAGLPNRYVTDVAPALRTRGLCYVSLGGYLSDHVWRTTDGGASWRNASGNLPDVPVNTLAIHPDDDRVIYAGTDIGVFVTLDGGDTWASYVEGLPRVEVLELEVHRARRVLRAATFGRGAWEIDLERPLAPASITAPSGGEIFTVGGARSIGWVGFDGPVKVELSTDDGMSWRDLARNVGGSGMLLTVPDAPTMWARVRVTAEGDAARTAASRAFTIERPHVGSVLRQSVTAMTPYGLAFDGTHLWTVNFFGFELAKLDAATLDVVETIPLQLERTGPDSSFVTDLTWHPERGTLFMHRLARESGGGGTIVEARRDGSIVRTFPSPATFPIGLAWMGSDNPDMPYLLASDRDGDQTLFVVDPESGETIVTMGRERRVLYGPRGLSSAGGAHRVYEAITTFVQEDQAVLVDSYAEHFSLDGQAIDCTIPIRGDKGEVNLRGIEYDPRDRNVWVSDYRGNVYKVVTCEGLEGTVSAPLDVSTTTMLSATPSPFTESTELRFDVAAPSHVTLSVHDAAGREVARLVDAQMDAGAHGVILRATGLPSGVYRCRLALDGVVTFVRPVVLVR